MFEAADLVAAARAQTGLHHLGDESMMLGLEIYVRALRDEASLTDRGWQSMRNSLLRTLCNRLRVEQHLGAHPELLQRPVERPLFVFGLPRTGTTLVINLLHQDPARRCLLRWEALDSAPPSARGSLRSDPRCHREQQALDLAIKHMPHISAIHHEDADSPTECQFLMSQTFCAQIYEAQAAVPSYRRWFLGSSYLPAFRYHKRLLQLLQSENPGRWTLKNPWHALYLQDLTSVYPDAQLAMTHRAPEKVVASFCSLIKNVRAVFSDAVDGRAIGRDALDLFEAMIERSEAYRARNGRAAIHDIGYDALLADPLGEMHKLYARFGEPLSEAAKAAMARFLRSNPQDKHGTHRYALEDYGLNDASVRERLGAYCERVAALARV